MTRVCCPECGYDLSVGKLDEGSQTTARCDNCSSELIVAIQDGEIKANNTSDYSYSEITEEEQDY